MSFDFSRMNQDTSFIAGGVPRDAFARAISEPGKQYAFYIHHSDIWVLVLGTHANGILL